MVVSSSLTNEKKQRALTMPSSQLLCPFSLRLNEIRGDTCCEIRYCLPVSETKFPPNYEATKNCPRVNDAIRCCDSNGTNLSAKEPPFIVPKYFNHFSNGARKTHKTTRFYDRIRIVTISYHATNYKKTYESINFRSLRVIRNGTER